MELPAVLVSVLRDDQYNTILQQIQPRNKGRPFTSLSQLPRVLNNRLLLQLQLVRQESGISLKDLQAYFLKLCCQDQALSPLSCSNVSNLIQTCLVQFETLQHARLELVEDFLNKELDLVYFGQYSSKYSVSKDFLLSLSAEDKENNSGPTLHFIPVGLLLEINQFRIRKQFTVNKLLFWLQALCGQFNTVTVNGLNRMLKTFRTKVNSLQRRKSDCGGADELQIFMDMPTIPIPSCEVASTITTISHLPCSEESGQLMPNILSVVDQPEVVPITPIASSSFPQLPVQDETKESVNFLAPLSASINHCCYNVTNDSAVDFEALSVITQCSTLKKIVADNKVVISELKDSLLSRDRMINQLKVKIRTLNTSQTTLKSQLLSKKQECNSLKYSNINRKLRRLQEKYADKVKQYQKLDDTRKQLQSEKTKKRAYQRFCSSLRLNEHKLKDELKSANEMITMLLKEMDTKPYAIPKTKTESGYYLDFVLKCIYQLIGECEVSARRCRDVIQTVAHHMFGVDFPNDSLPSVSSNLRFADQSQALAKVHVAESIRDQKFDLHADGTSKSNKKVIGLQVTLENHEVLSMGYIPIASENAQTVLDIAIGQLSEMACLLSPEESEAEMKKMLSNLISVMSDRASTMKCFGKLLNQYCMTTLEREVQIEYLHCNAHFLLGASTAVDKALGRAATDSGLDGQLGREQLAVFSGYKSKSTESAVCRFVRMACDILGPRGDEKCGCHADWLAFCAAEQKLSLITSFRGNRFNNLFAAAAQLIHHKGDIVHFFQLRPPTNLKQRSVASDASCEKLTTMLLGLALIYAFITCPFWSFVKSNMHYLDQYIFIQPMFSSLETLINYPELLLNKETTPGSLEQFRMQAGPSVEIESVLRERDALTDDKKQILQLTIHHLAEDLVAVMQRQLVDFLPGGKYGSEPTEEQRSKMKHCQLTNLIGEACFGDLDYSMFTRRGATLHHHSTVNMLKRNHTVSKWLQEKSPQEQDRLMKQARCLGIQIRATNRQQQLLVWEEIARQMKQKQKEDQDREQNKQEKLRQNIAQIVQSISEQGGACQSAAQVLSVLRKYSFHTQKQKAIIAQMDYQRKVLKITSPLLKTSKLPLESLAGNFISYLCGELTEDIKKDLIAACVSHRVKRGRKRKNKSESSDENESSTSMDPEEDVDSIITEIPLSAEDELKSEDFLFQFTSQGQTVAVFYSEGEKEELLFYIGQVVSIETPLTANISFMSSRGKGSQNVFRWPDAEDLDLVEARHVFYSNFEILPKQRTWEVAPEHWKILQTRWASFKRLFC